MVSTSMNLKEKSMACGADDYVEKPFDINVLTGKVTKWGEMYQQKKCETAQIKSPT
jgi:DNA-binding response OmpR family regulator